MKLRKYLATVAVAFVAALSSAACASADSVEDKLAGIALPEGFEISVYADDVPNARSLCLGDNGTVFVGNQNGGQVYAIVDTDGDNVADKTHVLIEKDQVLSDGTTVVQPNGVAFRDGALYVAAIGHVLRLDDIESKLDNPGEPVIVSHVHPDDTWHGWKFIAFGPDDKLYVPVGAPCNVCERDEIYASMTRMNPDGTELEIVAHGIRNTVGFDWHPVTGELWFTDNGRDTMGDDMPADELNKISEEGQHFGFPYIHQGDTQDPYYGKDRSPDDFTPPEINLGPHVAAIGMRFYTGAMFPAKYKNQIFIAEHGSWNRRTKIGYRVSMVTLENGKAVSYEPFAEGWLEGRRVHGRPVDVLVMPDGSLLVSDDLNGAVYRIAYNG